MVYTSGQWIFRTTGIGNLYEIANHFPVVLLSEKLDEETEKALRNKKWFPYLEEIIPVEQFGGEKRSMFQKNKYLAKLAKEAVLRHRPAMVISITDTYPFDMYLMREAKKIGAKTVCLQSALHAVSLQEVPYFVDRINALSLFPDYLPLFLKLGLVKIRKLAGYALYNFILPLAAGRMPFLGTGVSLYSPSGFKADYHIAYSKDDCELNLREGLSSNKIFILKHPLARSFSRKIFEAAYFSKIRRKKTKGKTLTILFPSEMIGFRKKNRSIIGKEESKRNILRILSLVALMMKKWKILVKVHPTTRLSDEEKKEIQSISKDIVISSSSDPMDRFIETSDMIVGTDEPSTAIFTAVLQCPEKPILAIDLFGRIHGCYYEGLLGVEYIDNREKLVRVLSLVKNNKYRKKAVKKEPFSKSEFKSAVDMIDSLLKKQNDTA